MAKSDNAPDGKDKKAASTAVADARGAKADVRTPQGPREAAWTALCTIGAYLIVRAMRGGMRAPMFDGISIIAGIAIGVFVWFWMGTQRGRDGVKSVASTIAIFLFLRAFLVEAYRIPSGSMVPTLLVGDWLFVNKLRYGPNIPYTHWNLPGYADPQRGDVAVFESPNQIDQPDDPTPTLVKRVQGTPGDTLYMREGQLYVNGEKRIHPFKVDTLMPPESVDPLFVWQKQYELTGSRFGAPLAQPNHDNWGPLLLPSGFYFMMGDARYDSKDSRYWGIVPRKNFRGRPMFVYYSYNKDDSDRAAPFITDIRWKRLGTWIR